MMLFFYPSIAFAEVETIWIDRSVLSSTQFPQDISLGFLEQEQDNALLFELEEQDRKRLEKIGIPFEEHAEQKSLPYGYRDTRDAVEVLQDIAHNHPDRVELHTLGRSHQGRPILGIYVSDSENPLNTWKILGTHHGDELSASEVSLDFIEDLNERMDDPDISLWLQDNALWIVPHVNPDGVEAVSRHNSNQVDLNRNYAWEWDVNAFHPGTHPFSEPETQAIRLLEEWNSFTGGLSLHSGAANISWVWNYSLTPTIDDTLMQDLAADYADHCAQPGFWISNGAEWYITHGDTTDWAYGAQGSFDLTLEVSENKRPSSFFLDTISGYHIPAIWNFLNWEHWISAQVFDAETQEPLRAEWTLAEDGILDRGSLSGRLTRPVASSGFWTVEISAAGYQSETISIESGEPLSIFLERSNRLDLNCQLQEAGRIEITLPDTVSSAALFHQGEEVLALEPQGGLWRAESLSLRSGVYDLYINDAEWARNAVLLVDVIEEPSSAEERWIIDNTQLSLLSGESIPSSACVFQFAEGTIIGMGTEAQGESDDTSEESDSREEDSGLPRNEPSTEPSEESDTNVESKESEIRAGGCQLSQTPLSIWLSGCALFALSTRRNRIHRQRNHQG